VGWFVYAAGASHNFIPPRFSYLPKSNTIKPVQKDGSMKAFPRYLLVVVILLAGSSKLLAQKAAAPPKFQISADKLAAFVGQYQYDDDPDLVRSITVDGSHLFSESLRTARYELLPQSEDTFSPLNVPVTFKFLRSTEGAIVGFNRIVADGTTHARKISAQPLHFSKPEYTRQDVMIPTRDGVKLHAVILRPKDYSAPLPFLMERTPYGVDGNTADSINSDVPELASSRYIFVFEDIRGRYKSEGTFVMSRPMADHRDSKLVDESTDTCDTVAWLLKNIPNNNGRVGVHGISYPGFLAMAAGIDPHPAVKAISPQAPMIDVWMGDDFFHNGAFRETYGYDYALGMESSKENAFSKLDEDAYDFFLHSGSFEAAAKHDGVDKLPTGVAFLQHPDYDEFWRARAVELHLDRVAVPTLFVGGFWDQEDMFGPQEAYSKLEPHDARHENFMVIGPWNHGQWGGTTRHLGAVQFGEPTTDEFRKRYEAPFFAHYLKEESGFSLRDTAAFETGSNRWREYTHWPPQESKSQNLYLSADGSLALASSEPKKPPQEQMGGANYREYVSDPANPVPYRHRPIQATYSQGSQWYNWMVEDQRFVSDRPDVATWTTSPLDHDVTVAGDVIADLFASTTGTDADWVVKLIDEYPDLAASTAPAASTTSQPDMSGYQLIINAEIFRGRYRKSFEHPEAIPANEMVEYRFSLHAADHTFLKGHRIKVQVQSTWFPLYDRNPQKFLPNIMTASPGDFSKATQRVYPASHLILPLAP
jgi:putative CocE/NonD family hydrolase